MRKILALMMFVAVTILPTQAGSDIDAFINQLWDVDTNNLAVPTVSMGKAASFELQVDVSCAAFTLSLGNDPFQQPFPAGQPFVIQGYIYPGGTYAANGADTGINEDGSPEFADSVLGIWTCRGWLLGPTPTTLIFNLISTGDSVIVDGFEPSQGNQALRPVTGGTGTYNLARGQVTQDVVGMNLSGAPNFVFDFTFRPRIDFKSGAAEE
jgi:hypothetical protein